jgi:hypothetical protein
MRSVDLKLEHSSRAIKEIQYNEEVGRVVDREVLALILFGA